MVFYIGNCFYNGKGVVIDYGFALLYYKKAVELGNLYGAIGLGDCYSLGKGVALNRKAAFEWYKKAADADICFAMGEVGDCYMSGLGVAYDFKKGMEYYEKSSRMEDACGMYKLGSRYYDTEDYKHAIELLEKSAAKGYFPAISKVGKMYHYGKGVAKDMKKAVELYAKSAEHGEIQGMIQLGKCYQWGWGVDVDLIVALKWYKPVLDQGYRTLILDELSNLVDIRRSKFPLIDAVYKMKIQNEKLEAINTHLRLFPGTDYKEAEKDFYEVANCQDYRGI